MHDAQVVGGHLAVLEGPRQRDVLLCDEAHGDAAADGLVEEGANLLRGHVSRAFLEATGDESTLALEGKRSNAHPFAIVGMSLA